MGRGIQGYMYHNGMCIFYVHLGWGEITKITLQAFARSFRRCVLGLGQVLRAKSQIGGIR